MASESLLRMAKTSSQATSLSRAETGDNPCLSGLGLNEANVSRANPRRSHPCLTSIQSGNILCACDQEEPRPWGY